MLAEIDTIETQLFTLSNVVSETIIAQGALPRLEAFVHEMSTEVAGTEVPIGIIVVDQGLRTIEVGDIEVGALGQGTWMTKQTYQYLGEIHQMCQMSS